MSKTASKILLFSLVIIFAPSVVSAQVAAPTITLTAAQGAPTLLLQGTTDTVFRFTVRNNDTAARIYISDLCVSMQAVTGVPGTLFSITNDIDTITLTNDTGQRTVIFPVTGDPACVSLVNRTDTAIDTGQTSAIFYVLVTAKPFPISDGGRFTMDMTRTSTLNHGLRVRAVSNNADITVDHAAVTPDITIPVVAALSGDVSPYRYLVSPNSDQELLLGLKIAGITKTPPDRINSVKLRFYNHRNFIPGGTSDTGDLDHIHFYKDGGDGTWGASGNRNPDDGSGLVDGTEIRAGTYARLELGVAMGVVEKDSYEFDFPWVHLGAIAGSDIPDMTQLPVSSGGLTFKGSTHWMSFETNRRFSSEILANGVGAGDRWSFEVLAVNTTMGTFIFNNTAAVGSAVTPVISMTMTDIDSGNIIVPVHLSDRPADFISSGSTSGAEDGAGLEFLEFTPVFGFHMLGGPTSGPGGLVNVPPRLQRIQLTIRDPFNTINLMDITSPLRAINGSKLSGIQLRRNRNNLGAIFAHENSDSIVPIDMSQTTYINNAGYDTLTLVFQPDQLPTPHVKPERSGSNIPLTNDWVDNIVSSIDFTTFPMNNEYILGVLASSNARFGDTLDIEIPSRGVIFNQGVSSETYLTARSRILFGPPLLPADMVTTGDILGESSPPTDMLRFRITGNNKGERLRTVYTYFIDTSATGAQLSQSDFLDHDFSGNAVGPFTNALDPTNNLLAGVAIYRDMNNNGLYDLNIDSPVRFDPALLGPASGTGFINTGLDVNLLGGTGALLARMFLDPADPLTAINTGESNVFFVCIRSSATVDPRDLFFGVLGDLDAVRADGRYHDGEPVGVHLSTNLGNATTWTNQNFLTDGTTIYGNIDQEISLAGWRREDHFRSTPIRGETLEDVAIFDLTSFNQTVFGDSRAAVFGINLVGAADISVRLDTLAVVVADAGAAGDFNQSVDLKSIDATANSGIAIFADNGTVHGAFDPADQVVGLIPFDAATLNTYNTTGRLMFTFSPTITIPADDLDTNAGSDLYVVINPSTSVTFRDDFVVAIPNNAFGFSNKTSKIPGGDTSAILTAGLPVIVTGVGDTSINTNGTPLGAIGISAADITSAGDGNVFLTQVKVKFTDVGNFSLGSVRALTNDTNSGVALYRDNGTVSGAFDAADQFVTLTAAPTAAGLTVTMTPAGAGEAVPSTNAGADTGPDWFVVLRASASCDVLKPDTMIISIPTGGLQWSTPFAPDVTFTTGIISCTGIPPAGILAASPSLIFSPNNNDGVRDTVGIRVQLPLANDSVVQIALINPAGGEQIPRKTALGPDVTFTFSSADALPSLEYTARVFYSDQAGAKTIDFKDSIIVDSTTRKPNVTVTQPSAASVTVKVKADGINLDPTLASGTATERSAYRSAIAAENFEGFSLVLKVTGTAAADSTTQTASIAANVEQAFSHEFTVNLFNGRNTITVTMVDAAGNSITETKTFTIGAVAGGSTQLQFEGDEPMFRYNAVTNPEFTFTFESPIADGGIEVYSSSGARLGVVKGTAGSSVINWAPKNDQGTILRNGIYLLRFNLRFQDGSAINQTRNLFLLK